jgi:uncharacterized protein (TIGR02217 family)
MISEALNIRPLLTFGFGANLLNVQLQPVWQMLSANFHNVRLDPEMSYGAVGGPAFNVQIQAPSGGAERRVSLWSRGRGRWDVSYGVKTHTQAVLLLAFYNARLGPTYSFKMQAPLDYEAINEPLINNGLNTIQLVKTYYDSVNSIAVPVVKPATDLCPVTMTKNGAPFANFTVNSATGIVTLDQAYPGAVFTWSGYFDKIVRFDVMEGKFTEADFDEANWDGITVTEVWGEG